MYPGLILELNHSFDLLNREFRRFFFQIRAIIHRGKSFPGVIICWNPVYLLEQSIPLESSSGTSWTNLEKENGGKKWCDNTQAFVLRIQFKVGALVRYPEDKPRLIRFLHSFPECSNTVKYLFCLIVTLSLFYRYSNLTSWSCWSWDLFPLKLKIQWEQKWVSAKFSDYNLLEHLLVNPFGTRQVI